MPFRLIVIVAIHCDRWWLNPLILLISLILCLMLLWLFTVTGGGWTLSYCWSLSSCASCYCGYSLWQVVAEPSHTADLSHPVPHVIVAIHCDRWWLNPLILLISLILCLIVIVTWKAPTSNYEWVTCLSSFLVCSAGCSKDHKTRLLLFFF